MKFIGIDPGVNTGFAVWCSEKQAFDEVRTTSFWTALSDTEMTIDGARMFGESDGIIVIEDPSQNKPIFPRKLKGENKQSYARRMLKIGKNVGQNLREGTLLIERFEALGYNVLSIAPKARKLNATVFKATTGYKGRTSQHARDAAMLVYGRTEQAYRRLAV